MASLKDFEKKIYAFYKRENRMPTYAEMTDLFNYKSKNAVAKVVNKLIDAGKVMKDHLGRLVPASKHDDVPMLGFVTAGFPTDVEDELNDTVDLEELLIGKKDSTYMLTVDGDSMIEAHIEDGDLVLVEKTEQAKDGDIVIAEVDGEFTMKYLREKGNKRWLEPANCNYKPIHPKYDLKIIAKLKAVIRKY